MRGWLRIGVSAMVTGTAASVVSTAGLALLAQREGKIPCLRRRVLVDPDRPIFSASITTMYKVQ